ncbi:MAG: hypothetical protein IT379_11410 [Deltaproteobacteria bacterium]|nr:hypothetical protein [Deltaproteobacteria bacterium]
MTSFEHEDFGLTAAELWDDPRKTFHALDDRLSDEGFTGLRIAAPRLVPLGVRETVPLLVYHSATFEERRRSSFDDHGAIVAIDVLSNVTYARSPVEHDGEEVKPRRDPPTKPAPKGLTSQLFVTDLRDRLRLPWTRARYVVVALLRDQMSNRLVIEVDRPPGTFRDEEVERFLEAQRVERADKDVWPEPGNPYPHFRREPAHPSVPQSVGISLVADRVSVRRPEGALPGSAFGRCVVRASFRLPVLPHELLATSGESAPGAAPTALVRIGLVILGADDGNPLVLRLRVPSFDPIVGGGQPVVTGHFALDLLAMDEMPERAQTYFVYAFSGEEMAGPVPAAVVDEASLPSVSTGPEEG